MRVAALQVEFRMHCDTLGVRLPRAADMRRYGTLVRPAFFTEIFNN